MNTMRLLSLAASLMLNAACARQQVSVNTPATPPPENGQVISPSTPAPISRTNNVEPAPGRLAQSDTTARPVWLQKRIDAVLAERKRNPLTHIYQYQYGGQTVYYISAPCCDQYSELFDRKGKLVCNPDGGMTGKGDGRCPDFNKKKANEKLVWQDPR
jgi:hypothetical protein